MVSIQSWTVSLQLYRIHTYRFRLRCSQLNLMGTPRN
nr:MAG TPA: hypothetical protein [Caudoviricetes sp.]